MENGGTLVRFTKIKYFWFFHELNVVRLDYKTKGLDKHFESDIWLQLLFLFKKIFNFLK